MKAEEPKVALTGRYSTRETTEVLGITKDTLRKYRREGKIKFGVRKANGRPFYTGAEIMKLWRASL